MKLFPKHLYHNILTALTVLFQLAPVFLPLVGLFLSPLSTLPIAIAAASNIPLGLTVFLASAVILAIINMQELLILLFTTGLLGFVIGTLLFRRGILISILSSSIALSLGMTLLNYILGITIFLNYTFLIFFLFSLVYVSIWNIYLKKYTPIFLRFFNQKIQDFR